MELKYEEITDILERQVIKELVVVSLSVGMYHPSWRIVQKLCLELAQHIHPHVRANANS